jgi:hypothetical protein
MVAEDGGEVFDVVVVEMVVCEFATGPARGWWCGVESAESGGWHVGYVFGVGVCRNLTLGINKNRGSL